MAVTPVAADNYIIPNGGVPVVLFGANPNGGLMVNSPNAADQGVTPAEDVFVNPVGPAALAGNGTTFRIPPGGYWNAIPGQTTQTTMNAESNGHMVSAVKW